MMYRYLNWENVKKIRDINNIDENSDLIIFKIDIQKEGLSMPIVEYEIYDSKTKKKLELPHCKIDLLLPVSNAQDDIFKNNISSEYYNDICFTYTTENGTDIILSDRKNEFIDRNMSLCEPNCFLNEYNKETKMAKCECDTKADIPLMNEVNFDKDKLIAKFIDISNILNLQLLKCYKKLFTLDGLKINLGSYVLLLILFIHIYCALSFIMNGFKTLSKMIMSIMGFSTDYNKNNKSKLGSI